MSRDFWPPGKVFQAFQVNSSTKPSNQPNGVFCCCLGGPGLWLPHLSAGSYRLRCIPRSPGADTTYYSSLHPLQPEVRTVREQLGRKCVCIGERGRDDGGSSLAEPPMPGPGQQVRSRRARQELSPRRPGPRAEGGRAGGAAASLPRRVAQAVRGPRGRLACVRGGPPGSAGTRPQSRQTGLGEPRAAGGPRPPAGPASLPRAAHPPLPRGLPLALLVAPAFLGISALKGSRPESPAPRPDPSRLSPRPSRSIPAGKPGGGRAAPEERSAPARAAGGSDPTGQRLCSGPRATPPGRREHDPSSWKVALETETRIPPPRPPPAPHTQQVGRLCYSALLFPPKNKGSQ